MFYHQSIDDGFATNDYVWNMPLNYQFILMNTHIQLLRLFHQEANQIYANPDPTPQELYHSIQILQKQMIGLDLLLIFHKLSTKMKQFNYQQSYSRFPDDCETRIAKQEQLQMKQEMNGFPMPAFEIRQIVPKVRIKENKQKPEERDWLKQGEKKKDVLSGQVWNRYGNQRSDDAVSKASSSGRTLHTGQNDQNIKKIELWDMNSSNRQFRLIANKTAPRFNNKDQEVKYYEKRIAAKIFSDKKNQSKKYLQSLDAVSLSSYYGKKAASRSHIKGFQQKRRDKNIKNSFIVEAFRKFQIFIMDQIDKRIHPITGAQMRVLYPVLIKAPEIFSPDEYHAFRKFVKYSFDLGSVSVYQKPVRELFRTIHLQLKEKLNQYSNKIEAKSSLSESRRSWNVKYDSVSMVDEDQHYQQFNKKGLIKMNLNMDDQLVKF